MKYFWLDISFSLLSLQLSNSFGPSSPLSDEKVRPNHQNFVRFSSYKELRAENGLPLDQLPITIEPSRRTIVGEIASQIAVLAPSSLLLIDGCLIGAGFNADPMAAGLSPNFAWAISNRLPRSRQNPESCRACRFPAHRLTMIFLVWLVPVFTCPSIVSPPHGADCRCMARERDPIRSASRPGHRLDGLHRVRKRKAWFLTVQRAIAGERHRHLMTVYEGRAITKKEALGIARDYYVREGGAASNELGFAPDD